jgi:hypothetical protein
MLSFTINTYFMESSTTVMISLRNLLIGVEELICFNIRKLLLFIIVFTEELKLLIIFIFFTMNFVTEVIYGMGFIMFFLLLLFLVISSVVNFTGEVGLMLLFLNLF